MKSREPRALKGVQRGRRTVLPAQRSNAESVSALPNAAPLAVLSNMHHVASLSVVVV
jgi:hypothetical protein